ncbi:transcriptional regulator [Enterococcus florum]|uniref:Transcriptional regulator n=1 Tax=Enterococcus florum TaxID=2480627 RepID=A0A4P5PA47_9ENTE|nr:DUF3267 domain-containing protein [Enterococcus florum]GCF94820.1 transcriptional regulator [Enterococcus florum]
MKLLKSIDLLNDQQAALRLNLAAIPLMLVFYFAFNALTNAISVDGPERNRSLAGFLLEFLVFLFLIVLHELIHGLFFKVFAPNQKVKFGFKNGLAYATAPGSIYSKGTFAWISLAPFVLITLGLFGAYLASGLSRGAFVLIAAIHAGACVGDFYWIYLLLKAPAKTLVKDTEVGLNLYKKETTSE